MKWVLPIPVGKLLRSMSLDREKNFKQRKKYKSENQNLMDIVFLLYSMCFFDLYPEQGFLAATRKGDGRDR